MRFSGIAKLDEPMRGPKLDQMTLEQPLTGKEIFDLYKYSSCLYFCSDYTDDKPSLM